MNVFDDVPTVSELRVAKKHKYELSPYKRTHSVTHTQPTTNLEQVSNLEPILQDINRPYIKDVTHLHGRQFFLLADCLNDFARMAPVLRTKCTVSVSLIIIIIYIIV